MSKKLPAFSFELVEDTSQVFIKNYDEKSEVGHIREVDVKYPNEVYKLHGNLPFLPERKLLPESLLLNSNINVKMLFA